MVQRHDSSPAQRAQCASILIAHTGEYGIVTNLSREMAVSRQTLYTWKTTGLRALQDAFTFTPVLTVVCPRVERSILTLLVEGHASQRGILRCLEEAGYGAVGLGTVSSVVSEAERRALEWFDTHKGPATSRVLALDEQYGNQRRGAYLSVVDAGSQAVWVTAGPVAVDAESWTLLLWEAQEHGVRWHQTISDGGKAIERACLAVDPQGRHGRDVWHLLHECSRVQGRIDRRLADLQGQSITVARQAERVAAGQRPRGRKPVSDVTAHAADVAVMKYVSEGLHYLSSQLRRLLEVVVLDHRGLLDGLTRQQELEALLELLAELAPLLPATAQGDLQHLHTRLRHALPKALVFTEELDRVQQDVATVLGADGLVLLRRMAWAWQRRAILGPKATDLLPQLPQAWRGGAAIVMAAWECAVRASSAVENWHSILRPHLAVHRKLTPGLLALLAVWHNHRVFTRGVHAGQSPLQRSGMADVPTDWLVALGYPPTSATSDAKPHTVEANEMPMAA